MASKFNKVKRGENNTQALWQTGASQWCKKIRVPNESKQMNLCRLSCKDLLDGIRFQNSNRIFMLK
jgi:hypothetical protein